MLQERSARARAVDHPRAKGVRAERRRGSIDCSNVIRRLAAAPGSFFSFSAPSAARPRGARTTAPGVLAALLEATLLVETRAGGREQHHLGGPRALEASATARSRSPLRTRSTSGPRASSSASAGRLADQVGGAASSATTGASSRNGPPSASHRRIASLRRRTTRSAATAALGLVALESLTYVTPRSPPRSRSGR